MPAHSAWERVWRTSFHPMCGTLSRSAVPGAAVAAAYCGHAKRRTVPGNRARHGVWPSSLDSNSICSPTHTPSRGLARAARTTASRRPDSVRVRMESAMAPWPGKTTRTAAGRGALAVEEDAAGGCNVGGAVADANVRVGRGGARRPRHGMEAADSVVDDGNGSHNACLADG